MANMKMFLLRTIQHVCSKCDSAALVIIRADDEAEARQIARRSNSHGEKVTGIDWASDKEATCTEFPFLDGPKGIVVGSWFEQHLPS